MFMHVSNASKVAFVKLVEHLDANGFDMIDCQMTTRHLLHFGAREVPRSVFLDTLALSLSSPSVPGSWNSALLY
jgi:leucyl/phenylalanyl-tRNA--protein transferase